MAALVVAVHFKLLAVGKPGRQRSVIPKVTSLGEREPQARIGILLY